MKSRVFAAAGLAAFLTLGVIPAAIAADDVPTFEISIKDHMFTPNHIEVPAGKDVRLVVKNLDPTPEEFESYDFNVEKIIAGGGQGTFLIAPLEKGDYKFFGEFHEDTAQGVLTAK